LRFGEFFEHDLKPSVETTTYILLFPLTYAVCDIGWFAWHC